MLQKLNFFFRETKGATIITFAVLLIPILAVVSMVIDYSRVLYVKNKVQAAADAAVLAGAVNLSGDNAKTVTLNVFQSNIKSFTDQELLNAMAPKIEINGNSVSLTASNSLKTVFSEVIGIKNIDFSVSSKSVLANDALELVLVFDTTRSMDFGDNWTVATATLKNMLETIKSGTKNSNFHLSFVPFGDRVNVGWHRTSWLSDSPPYKFRKTMEKRGCVKPRERKHIEFDFAVDDAPPTGADRFDTDPGGHLVRKNDLKCPSQLVEHSTDIDTIIDSVEDIKAKGTGRFDVAMAWGWRLLSPKWRGHWEASNLPADYDKSKKAVIFLSDGHTVIYDVEVVGPSGSTSYGSNQGSKEGFAHFVHVCERMKAEGIEIFTIFSNAAGGNKHFVPYLQSCASGIQNYYEVDKMTDFEPVLNRMIPRLMQVRISE